MQIFIVEIFLPLVIVDSYIARAADTNAVGSPDPVESPFCERRTRADASGLR
jgi:hypothetical protein